MPQRWNDDRLDELGHRVDKGFALVDERFRQVDERFRQVDERFKQVDVRFEQVDDRFAAVDHRFDKVDAEIAALRSETNLQFQYVNTRLDRLIQTTMVIGGGIIATLVATCVTALLAV